MFAAIRGKRDVAPWSVAIAAAFAAMRWLGQHRLVAARLDHAPGAVLVSAAIATRWAGGFTPGLFAAVGAVALARWAGLS